MRLSSPIKRLADRHLHQTAGGSSSITGLSDTPSSFGNAGQVLKVNNAGDAVVWRADDDSGAEDFTDLGDTPSSIGQNRVVVGNGTGTSLAFDQIRDFHIGANAVETAHIRDDNVTSAKIADNVLEANPAFTSATSLTGIRIHNATFTVGGGAEDFTDLGDTPAALGIANDHVRVNAAGDGLEFGQIPTTSANPVVAGVQLAEVSNVNLTTTWATWSNFTNAHFGINRGGFTLAQQSNRELIVVPEAGIYVFYVNTNIGDADDGDREAISLRARVVRGGTPLTSVPISRNYYRGLSDITDYSLTVGALFDLQVGDQVGFELKTESAAIDGVTINTTGSYMSLIKIQGARGQSMELAFNRSATQPTAPTPSDFTAVDGSITVYPTGWDDEPGTGTDTVWAAILHIDSVTVDVRGVFQVSGPAGSGGGGGADDFTDLGDTPSALGTAGQVVKVNTAGDALIFAADDTGGGGGGGASDFVDLDDTPSSITADRLVAGNGAGDALVFIQAGTAQIASNAITNAKVANGAIDTDQLAVDAVTQVKIADNAVGTTQLISDSVTSAKIPNNAIGATEIAANAVGDSEIANQAVGTSELEDGSITSAKFGADAVDDAALSDAVLRANPTGAGSTDLTKLEVRGTIYNVGSGGGGGGTVSADGYVRTQVF